ncbi:recombinase family protein [Bdellovibrio bacteriovorus]|uniref:Putative serine recombinase n=1 Tax=Bdellovibrio bacteriovorus str. Tiberius TaxID=1069642 RepID=K7YQZ3_BDEBC|nr:recombinase family protein [Bdellovibrio bacteriovorus]AFX99947.1 Putative serine recombinase [Bdellovibrio bacteriovorus str. Tiberius]
MKNAAIYARVSTSHHDQNPEVQLSTLRRFCRSREWKIEHEIIDHGYTGGNDKRPGLKRLMELAKCREIDAIVVLKMDRLFRSLKHLVTALDDFSALGIEFVAVTDNIDYTTPSGRLFVQVLGSLAEFEKALVRERTLLGLQHAKAKGKTLGRPRTIDSDVILSLDQEGCSQREIQKRTGVSKGTIWRVLKACPKNPSETSVKKPNDFNRQNSESECPTNERIVGTQKSDEKDKSSGNED